MKKYYNSQEDLHRKYKSTYSKDVESIDSPLAANIISSTNIPKKKTFAQMFPAGNEDALDLLKHLLAFNPNQRYTAQEAL